MSANLAISLDAMGGDNAPEMVIRGADIARQRFPDAQVELVTLQHAGTCDQKELVSRK